MRFIVNHHLVFAEEFSDNELRILQKSLRIWSKNHQGELICTNLFRYQDNSFPSGYLATVLTKLKKRSITVDVVDKRRYPGAKLFFEKKCDLKPLWETQKEALTAIESNHVGIICSIMGSGKSRLILESFLLRRVKTLVIVPNKSIQDQLYKDFCDLLGVKNVSKKKPVAPQTAPTKRLGGSYSDEFSSEGSSPKKVLGQSYEYSSSNKQSNGRLGSTYYDDFGKKDLDPEDSYLKRKKDKEKLKKWQKKNLERDNYRIREKKIKEFAVTILCFQSLDSLPRSFLDSIECVLVDECHHSSTSYVRETLIDLPNAAYRYYFSATPWRDNYKDQMLLISAIGNNLIYELSGSDSISKGIIAKPKYVVIQSPTPATWVKDLRNWRNILEEAIIGNKTRNKAIVDTAEDEVRNGRNVFICVDEISHLEILKERLSAKGLNPIVIHGQIAANEKKENINEVSHGAGIVSIATMAVGEGTDLVNVDTVILASGGKGSIRFLQRIGRGLRKTSKKSETIIYDFFDWFNATLAKHSRLRKRLFVKFFE